MSFTKVSVAGIGTTGTITFTNVNVAGVITATSFSGSGANLTGVASTDNIRTNTNATFLQSVNVTGIVTTAGVNASGVITATSSIVGSAVTINASGINATGVITATSFVGSGANLTGLAATANVTTSSLVVIGVSTVAAGTTAAPSITPTGDSDTGIFFPSADTIAFGEGGVECARFDANGNFTVGTSSPVAGMRFTSLGGGVQISGSTSADGGIRFQTTSNVATITGINNDNNAFNPISFYTSATEAARIDTSGRLLVGTSSGSYKLNVLEASGADRNLFLAGIYGVTNGFSVDWVNSNSALNVKFANLSTTAVAANVHMDGADNNRLYRSTSSIRYKTEIENIEQFRTDAVLSLRPVWYRSTASNDRKDWSWYGLIAEEVAEIEPRLVHWSYLDKDYETTFVDGNVTKTLKEGAQLVPDGIQYDRIAVLLLDVVKRQQQTIEALEARLAALEAQ